jgi:hypothetical protein
MMERVAARFLVVLLGTMAISNFAAAETGPRAVGFLNSAEEATANLRALRETARSALKAKQISVEDLILNCSPSAECMRETLRDAGEEIGVFVWLWEPTEERAEAVVGAMFKEAAGVAGFDEVAEERGCARADCDRVIGARIEEPLRRWPERRGTRLSLTGTPAGAAVFDGASLVGTVPATLQLSWGEHRLRIASKGYEPGVLQIAAGPTSEEARRIDLVPLTEPNGQVDGTRRHRRAALIGTGVALLAGGGALIGLGGASYARSGGCEGTMPCQSYTTTNAGAGVMIGLGVASVGGGLGLLIKGIRDR